MAGRRANGTLAERASEARGAVAKGEERRPMKVAIVHDFLTQMGGAEKVVEVLHDMFPDAPVYTSVYDSAAMPTYYRTWDIHTTFLQWMPLKRRLHRLALMLYPIAFEGMDLSGFDLVISSSSAFAKGVVTLPDTLHVTYCHTPMRFAWMARGYMKNERAGRFLRGLLAPGLHYLRVWDAVATNRVDRFIANSRTVARRIEKFYRRECDIVHPPVDVQRFQISSEVEDYYLIASRCIPYKRIDLAIDAFTRLGRRLLVVGDGRQMKRLRARAGASVEFRGRVSDTELARLMSRAFAYVMPGEEDFGIAPVEANACGRPVIAYGAGGALDSQIDGVTGVLFGEQTIESLCAAVNRLDALALNPVAIREHAMRFSVESFHRGILRVIEDELARDGRAVAMAAAANGRERDRSRAVGSGRG